MASRDAPLSRLTGVGWSGSGLPSADGRTSPDHGARTLSLRSFPFAHCADFLSAKENSDSCKVRPRQESCDKPLECLTTDRGGPCAFYPAVQSSVQSPPRATIFHSSETALRPTADLQFLRTPIVQHGVGQRPPSRRAPVANVRSASDADDNRTALCMPPTARFTDLGMSVSLPTFIQ